MVYIDRNGRVWEKRPWDMQRIVEIFISLWYLIQQFFQTLFAPFNNGNGNRDNSRRPGSGWGGGGGWGSGGGGGGGGGGNAGNGPRTNRRIGRIQPTISCSTCPNSGG